jgi:hypothetical protein
MLKLSTTTKLKPEEVIKKAVSFFGPGGYGLKVIQQNETNVTLEGGGGMVDISAGAEDKKTSVDFETREWEIQVKEFAGKIKK